MTENTYKLSNLRRPTILVRAARNGAETYRRERDLPRCLRDAHSQPVDIVGLLFAEEDALNDARRARSSAYDHASHVAVLSALIAEARQALPPAEPPKRPELRLVQ